MNTQVYLQNTRGFVICFRARWLWLDIISNEFLHNFWVENGIYHLGVPFGNLLFKPKRPVDTDGNSKENNYAK